jgi:hypothetical protein
MSHVKIGPEFFRHIKRDYASWQFALVREFCQNAADGGANKIDFHLTNNPNGTVTLVVANNGRPMDRDTLEHKLLTLGGTSKEGDTTNTGGFGVAKSLLYYCHRTYQITTGDWLVRQRWLLRNRPRRHPHPGVLNTIVLDNTSADDLADRVEKFAATSQWNGTITRHHQQRRSPHLPPQPPQRQPPPPLRLGSRLLQQQRDQHRPRPHQRTDHVQLLHQLQQMRRRRTHPPQHRTPHRQPRPPPGTPTSRTHPAPE